MLESVLRHVDICGIEADVEIHWLHGRFAFGSLAAYASMAALFGESSWLLTLSSGFALDVHAGCRKTAWML